MKKFVFAVLGVLVFLSVLAGAGFGAFVWRFTPNIPEPNYPEPANLTDARKQDLDYLRRFPEADLSFSVEQLTAFNRLIDDLEARVDTMSEAEFVMGVSAAGAIPENGHSGVSITGTLNRLNSLPVRFVWFGDGLHVTRAHAEYSDLIGARVASYEGQNPEEITAKMDRYFGGNNAFLRKSSALFFAAPASLHAAGLIPSPDTVSLELIAADGETIERDLTVEPAGQKTEFAYPSVYALGQVHPKETKSGHDWRFLDPAMTEATWYGRDPNTVLWSDVLDNGGVYWRMRDIIGDAETPVGDWLEQQAAALHDNPADYLVIDLRGNAGGDYTQAMGVAREVGKLIKPDGRVYLLTDGDTFSAGIVTAYLAIHGAGDRAVLTGAKMGDETQFWAEGGGKSMVLPNSEIRLFASTGYHDWENGCSDWSKCFWVNTLIGVAVGPVEVDLPAPLLFADYVRGLDSGIQAILAAETKRAAARPAR
ncbi:hypothetical protein [Erythrobacter sp.]|uniref:hypothetical protein n=1 Tax=Sphingomonadales TaxID=204457 RepID=UPI00326410CB